MITLSFFMLALLLVVATRFIARKWCIGFFVGGLAFGIYNEVCFEFCWTYSEKLKPMIWRDVPLLVVIGWSIYTALALTISDRIVSRTGFKSGLVRLTLDVLLFFVIGFPVELIMSKLGYWQYNIKILGVTWMVIFGYFFVGLLVSCAGRSFQSLFDKKGRPLI